MKKKLVFLLLSIVAATLITASCGTTDKPQGDVSQQTAPSATETELSKESNTASETKSTAARDSTDAAKWTYLEGVDLDGKSIRSEILQRADITMINVWGTFCGPCIREMPDLGELSREYDGQKFQIVGVVVDAIRPIAKSDQTLDIDPDIVRSAKLIVEDTKASYQHMVPDYKTYTEWLSGIQAIPTTIFIDKSGNIWDVQYGSKTKSEWKEIIDTVIEVHNG